MPAMRGCALLVAWAAWAGLQVPWLHCASACHDKVVPAFVAHQCHDHAHEHPDAPEQKPRHERIEFAAVKSAGAGPTPGLLAAPPPALLPAPLPRAPSMSPPAPEHPPRAGPPTVVLLL